jgi:uncharacterized protein (TIGR02246 family)
MNLAPSEATSTEAPAGRRDRMKKLALSLTLAVAAAALAAAAHAAEMAKPATEKPATTMAKPAMATDAKAAIEESDRDFVAAWNAHDAKRMAAHFEEDGNLINPFGRVAQGRAAVEKLFTDEQTTVFKASTFTINSDSIRMLTPSLALVDWEVTITGMVDSAGKTMPPLPNHVTVVMRESGGHWHVVAGRPVVYLPPPAGAPAPAH